MFSSLYVVSLYKRITCKSVMLVRFKLQEFLKAGVTCSAATDESEKKFLAFLHVEGVHVYHRLQARIEG